MEQRIDEAEGSIIRTFGLQQPDLKRYSPLTLAYIGDAVYELVVRSYVTISGNAPVRKLYKRSREMVNAGAQSRMYGALYDVLSDEEKEVMRRGRNARSYTKAKNASISDYRRATGVETLMGYLYLSGRYERAVELIHTGLDRIADISMSSGRETLID